MVLVSRFFGPRPSGAVRAIEIELFLNGEYQRIPLASPAAVAFCVLDSESFLCRCEFSSEIRKLSKSPGHISTYLLTRPRCIATNSVGQELQQSGHKRQRRRGTYISGSHDHEKETEANIVFF